MQQKQRRMKNAFANATGAKATSVRTPCDVFERAGPHKVPKSALHRTWRRETTGETNIIAGFELKEIRNQIRHLSRKPAEIQPVL